MISAASPGLVADTFDLLAPVLAWALLGSLVAVVAASRQVHDRSARRWVAAAGAIVGIAVNMVVDEPRKALLALVASCVLGLLVFGVALFSERVVALADRLRSHLP